MRIDNWIDGDLVTIDTAEVWGNTFAEWDQFVDIDTAVHIATATEELLKGNPIILAALHAIITERGGICCTATETRYRNGAQSSTA